MKQGWENPVQTLRKMLQEDEDWAWSWQCNIAIHAIDLGVDHQTANRAAARFMSSVFHIDVKKTKYWKQFEKEWAIPTISKGENNETSNNQER